jgi:hypothetical protein
VKPSVDHRPQLADRARRDELAKTLRERTEAVLERLDDGKPTRAAWASTASVSATEMPSGFSHSTALPASSAAWASSAGRVDGADVHGIHVVAREHLVVRAGDRRIVAVGELTRPDAVSRTHRVQNSVFGVRQRRKEVARDDAGAQDRPACFVAHGSTLAVPGRAPVCADADADAVNGSGDCAAYAPNPLSLSASVHVAPPPTDDAGRRRDAAKCYGRSVTIARAALICAGEHAARERRRFRHPTGARGRGR